MALSERLRGVLKRPVCIIKKAFQDHPKSYVEWTITRIPLILISFKKILKTKIPEPQNPRILKS